MSIKKEVNESILLMNEFEYANNHEIYRNVDKMMAIGGDNFNSVCNQLNVHGEKAYTVCGSGDSPLELVKRGFSYIEVFDINSLARHMLFLKIAAIQALEYDEFILFSKYLFKEEKIYKKIELFMSLDTKTYFEKLFALVNPNDVYTHLVTHKWEFGNTILEFAKNNYSFYNEKDFYLLKEKLKTAQIIFKQQDLLAMPQLDKTYDFMYFSNIFLFNSMKVFEFKKRFLPIYIEHLNKGGFLVIHYMHHFIGNGKYSLYYDLKTQRINQFVFNEFKNLIDLEIAVDMSGFGKGTGVEDMALVLKK